MKLIEELLVKPNKAEALSWLDESTDESYRTVGELETNEQSIDLINEAYKAGAVEVIAVDIDEYPDGHQNTRRLVVCCRKFMNYESKYSPGVRNRRTDSH